MQMSTREDLARRRMPRARLMVPISVMTRTQEVHTQTLSLSAGGCAVVLDEAPPRDCAITLRVTETESVTGLARVVDCIEYGGRYYVCLAFIGLSESTRERIAEAVYESL